jgi:hypothetical protein
MALNPQVFLSLLALDAYYRGVGAGINNLSSIPNVSRIGNATIVNDSDRLLGEDARTAGFYAIAYEWNGETVISYRGSDYDPDIWGDVWQSWTVGAGFPFGGQPELALSFYRAVTGNTNAQGADDVTACARHFPTWH